MIGLVGGSAVGGVGLVDSGGVVETAGCVVGCLVVGKKSEIRPPIGADGSDWSWIVGCSNI